MDNYYFVGAVWNGDEDKTNEFLECGYWEMGWSPADKPKLAEQVNQIKPGEWIAIKAVSVQKNNLPFAGVPLGKSVSKMTIKAIGQVASNPQNGKRVYVDWQTDFKVKDWFFFTYRGTFWRINEQGQWWSQYASKLIDFAFNNKPQDYDYFVKNWSWNQEAIEMDEKNEMGGEHEALALNTILYGPPGTGKTFNTVDIAWQILNTNDSADTTRPGSIQELKSRYPGQVEFVTFHQSFSYEDFVEGIQAKTHDGKISYQVEDGVFKALAKSSLKNLQDSKKSLTELNQEVEFKSRLTDFLSNAIETEQGFDKKRGNPFYIVEVEQDSITLHSVDSKFNEGNIAVSLDDLMAVCTSLIDFEAPKDIAQQLFNKRHARQHDSYLFSLWQAFKRFNQHNNSTVEVAETVKVLPHVLIIDEINRGNISRIFGELITLIEPSKRAGNDEVIEVTLPYSKEPFSVPNNLYIIGTMNTADRSLALMDTALRRRFDFIEMMPQPGLVTEDLEGVDLRKMLQVMNQRIEALYDREHTLGHAFLMSVDSLDDLRHAFKNKILPLLEEYFYDDWQKIRWVLGASADNFYVPQSFSHLFSGNDANIENKFLRNNLDDLDDEAFVAIYQS
ncbi:ATPase [Thiomicrospira aerophila AL3]|uniref:ATPase n=1 Tax=Thiomicrospira aerophila AL3 TaxID=717772 RepID=W0DU88_9GAMM|nr:AAA family ATPase [Thiomicrospira aerophila]AHF00441.1 ATPase [Thiomicrospira aerophila AL3]